MVRRNSYRQMMKEGRFRAFRNLPVGWVLQALHSTDQTERWVRLGSELLLITGLWFFWHGSGFLQHGVERAFWAFVTVHTISWYLIGNFWVYMLDSFLWVRNPGIKGMLEYVTFVRRLFTGGNSCNAILIYGSMCRGTFHGRSDLDLRIVRMPGILPGLTAIYVGFAVRLVAAVRMIPVDLQVVDSLDFLKKQMRPDEHPIVVYLRSGFIIDNPGWDYDQIIENPATVLRDKPERPAPANGDGST